MEGEATTKELGAFDLKETNLESMTIWVERMCENLSRM
jgi:hypothetical protein